MTEGKDNYPPGVSDSDFDHDEGDGSMELYLEVMITEGDLATLKRYRTFNNVVTHRPAETVLRRVFDQIIDMAYCSHCDKMEDTFWKGEALVCGRCKNIIAM